MLPIRAVCADKKTLFRDKEPMVISFRKLFHCINTSNGSFLPSLRSLHLLQIKWRAKLQVTFFILVHLPCIHSLHSEQHTALDTIPFPHIPNGSILLRAIAFPVLLTIRYHLSLSDIYF